MHELVDNEYTAVFIVSDNVGQTCGVHVRQRCRLKSPAVLMLRAGWAAFASNSLWFVCVRGMMCLQSCTETMPQCYSSNEDSHEKISEERITDCCRQRAGHSAHTGVPAKLPAA